MNTVSTALRIPRFLIVLALAVALVAIPTFSPTDAGAYPMSEHQALRACGTLGGRAHYDFFDSELMYYHLTCWAPSGRNLFACSGWDIFVNCW